MAATSSDRIRASIAAGAAHVAAERTNDVDAIVGTISRQAYFPLLDHDGTGGLALELVTTRDEVARYYGARVGSYEVVQSTHIHSVSSDWYYFRESVATLRHVGEVGGVAGDGELFAVNSAVLFPTAADGISGEIVWTRYPFGHIVSGAVERAAPLDGPPHLPNAQLRNAAAHDRLLDALRAGDAGGIDELVADDVHWLERDRCPGAAPSFVAAIGREQVLSHLRSHLERWRYRRLELFNRIVTDWYVFADYRFELEDRASGEVTARRKVALYPLTDRGLVRAEMGDTSDEPQHAGARAVVAS